MTGGKHQACDSMPQCANAQTRADTHTMMRPDEAEDMNRRRRAKFAAIATVVAFVSSASPGTTAAGTDYFWQRIPRPAVTPPGRVVPLHAYLGDAPAFWPQPVHWRYNPAGAPGDLALNPD